MNWRDYEEAIYEILRSRFPANTADFDVMLPGRFSKIDRQIDVAGYATLMGTTMVAIVDCKCYSEKVDVKHVETVIGMAADVRADIALIVTTIGYSEAAKARALNEPNVRTHLDVVTTEEASDGPQVPAVTFMYLGRIGAVAIAPSGWAATSNVEDFGYIFPVPALCYLHPSNISIEEAAKSRRVGWCYISDNPEGVPNQFEDLLKAQKDQAIEFDPSSKFETWREQVGDSKSSAFFRKIVHKNAAYTDFTFFAELDEHGVFWASMICPFGGKDEALDRLRFVADRVSFAVAPHTNPTESDAFWQDIFPWRKTDG
ncbi:MAG: restriction endonuclease [Verrucomicrobiota bacterium]